MPRNDQVTRQWHVLRLLESHHGVTLDELMHELPADYPRHQRTLRRDLSVLETAGFPLVNKRVDGRVRWWLMDGFRKIPALNFSPTELMALLLGRRLLKPLEGTHIHSALDSALNKAAARLFAGGLKNVVQLSLKIQPIRPVPEIGQVQLKTRVFYDGYHVVEICGAAGFEFEQHQIFGARYPYRKAMDHRQSFAFNCGALLEVSGIDDIERIPGMVRGSKTGDTSFGHRICFNPLFVHANAT